MKNKLRLIAAFLPFLVGVKAYSQYCSPTTGTNGCLYGDYISSVNMGTITNSTSCSPGSYGDYTAMSTTVDLGNSYTATVGINPDFNQGVGIFVDWNHDNDFSDAGEFYGGSVVIAGGSTNISITVPTTATPGVTRMRVGCQYAVSIGASNSCATSGNYGEYEDYSLLVRNSLSYTDEEVGLGVENPTLGLASFSTCQTIVTLNANCTVNDGSTTSPGSYTVNVNGTTIGTYTGAQVIDLSAFIPVISVFIDPTEAMLSTTINGTVTVISDSPSTPVVPTVTSTVNYCAGDEAMPLSATLTGTGTTLKWYTSLNGMNYSSTAPTPSSATAGTTSYYVSQAETGGCESPRKKIDVVVNALPAAPTADNQIHCSSNMVSDLVPSPSATINWYSDESATVPLATTDLITGGDYYVGESDANGCNSPRTMVEVTLADNTGTVNQVACESYTWTTNGMTYTTSGAYTATLTNVAGCDSVVTLNLVIGEPTTGSETINACESYTWSANGTTYTTSGTYTATLQSVTDCDSIATLNLTINSLPVVTATDNGDGTVTASAGSSYQWINCDTGNPIANATQQTFSPTVNGNYSVEVTNASGCSDVSSCVLIDNLGVEDQSVVAANVYPNPTTGQVVIELNVSSARFTLTDAKGSIVLEGKLSNGGALDLSSYETGVYLLNLQHENGMLVKRIVKK